MVGINLSEMSKINPCPWIEFAGCDWSCLTNNLEPSLFKKNEIIYRQHDMPKYIYLVDTGRVCLTISSKSGEEKTFFVAESGCIFGELSAIDGISNMCHAIAVIDSYIFKIPKNLFLKELETNTKFNAYILRLIVNKTRLMTTQIKQLSFNDAKYRVCYCILQLVNKRYQESNEIFSKEKAGYQLAHKFTHQEMADLTGLSRVTVSNIISTLIKDDILKKSNGYYYVKDIDRIMDYIDDETII